MKKTKRKMKKKMRKVMTTTPPNPLRIRSTPYKVLVNKRARSVRSVADTSTPASPHFPLPRIKATRDFVYKVHTPSQRIWNKGAAAALLYPNA